MSRLVEPVSTLSDASIEELLASVFLPLIRLLAASGIPRSMLAEILRLASRELDALAGEEESASTVHLGSRQRECMELLCLWRRHKDFLGGDGRPAALAFDGDSSSFTQLCRLVSPERTAPEFLETLCAFEAVKVLADGRISPSTPTFLLGNRDQAGIMAADGVLKQLAGFLRVVDYNVRQSQLGEKRRFERACTVVIAEEYVPIFERAVRERGQVFIDVLDEWLERHRSMQSPSGRYAEIGAGAYFVDLGNIQNRDVSET